MNTPHINRIGTAVPAREGHEEFLAHLPGFVGDKKLARKLVYLGHHSGIEARYTVLDRPFDDAGGSGFYTEKHSPTTAERMEVYRREAPRLALRAAEDALRDIDRRRVTHLVVTTCTGFYAPGIDIDLVRQLGLPETTRRLIVGFMGCYSAMPGLQFARSVVGEDPAAVALVVSIELCSIHFSRHVADVQWTPFLIFADGAAAALVSSEARGLALRSFHSCLDSAHADAMRWHVGNNGFTMTLAPRLPEFIAQLLVTRRDEPFAKRRRDIRLWAVHPGGKAILDAVESELHLPATALTHSREVLRRCGNMSSPTVLFVLKRFLEDPHATGLGCAMAFGSGLTIEYGFFEKNGDDDGDAHGKRAH